MSKDKKQEIATKIINEISQDIDLTNRTVLELRNTEEPDVKTLSLKSGSWDASEPWFVVDEKNKIHTMISMDSVNQIIKNFKESQQESFNLKLEKTIWQNVPIDFHDVWAVAMDEIKFISKGKIDQKAIRVDLEKLIEKIKQEHPNLFLDLKDLEIIK